MENIIKNTSTHIPPHSTRAREVDKALKSLRNKLRSSARRRLKRLLEKAHASGYGMSATIYGEALNRIAEMETEEQFTDFCEDTQYLRIQLSRLIKDKVDRSYYFFKWQ